jgi:hypothetical protein
MSGQRGAVVTDTEALLAGWALLTVLVATAGALIVRARSGRRR